jgi:uncharacterized protein YjdB
MASETVKILTVDEQTPIPVALEGVLVRVFDATGTTLDSEATSALVGGDAVADLTLEGDDPPIIYQIRLHKLGVSFSGALGDDNKSPQLIEVYSPPASAPTGTNNFTVRGQTFSRPAAVDPRMCRCSGFFYRGDGLPYSNLDVVITPKFKPTIVDGNAVMGGMINARTDSDGYIEIDLFRDGEYSIRLETLEDCSRDVVVPDQASFNMPDLLFPVVEQVAFSPTSISLIVGEVVEVTPTVTASDDRVLTDAAVEDVIFTVADESVATIVVANGKIYVMGVSAGTTQVDVSRLDETVVLIPDVGVVYVPLGITVS